MMGILVIIGGALLLMMAASRTLAAGRPEIDETPAQPGEWGFRPAEGSVSQVTPPGFSWRPQEDAASYDVQCVRDSSFADVEYEATGVTFNVHCPPRTLTPGRWFWRFRFTDRAGETSEWSTVRMFSVAEDANALPLPSRDDLLARVPKSHPRLFVRPEQVPELRRRARTDLAAKYEELVATSEKLLENPPPTEEPPLYPEGTVRLSEAWRAIWWPNREYTIAVLNGAATLAFTRLLGGREEYGQLARELLMACAEWDPKGATGFRYNDEAGMPYAYYFSRTYSYLNDLLTEDERERCRRMMTVRGREMSAHLCPRFLWRPYGSHDTRSWHFLGEVGIAFLDEIPEAADWAWFAANVFANTYPVWSDDDGGWHQGMGYWRSYIQRFTWWADIMREAMGIDAFNKPYFSKVGYYPMYLQPPGTRGGGFGDLTAHLESGQNRGVMALFSAMARNPYWQWYVEAHGELPSEPGYIGFVRGALPRVEAKRPVDLPTSRCFRGTGQAVFNTDLEDARNNVELIFKSSPLGSHSHGYEAQNSFLLYAFGERLLIRTGRRDIHGSAHHRQWMHHTKSVNNITVNGEGQIPNASEAAGEILDFHTSETFDYVAGEAGGAYAGKLERFTRRIMFVKPDAILIFDTLVAPEPASFEWRLHAPVEMDVLNQRDVRVVNGGASCQVSFLYPNGLALSQTDRFEPPPRARIELVEYHLTAIPSSPAGEQTFVTVLRPHRSGETLNGEAELEEIDGGYAVTLPLAAGHAAVLLQPAAGRVLTGAGITTDGEVGAATFDARGEVKDTFVAAGTLIEAL